MSSIFIVYIYGRNQSAIKMKHNNFWNGLVFVFTISSSCIFAQNILVADGYTDENRPIINDSVHIYAMNKGSLQVFDHWEGNVQHVANIYDWHTKIKRTNQNVALRAIFKSNAVIVGREDIQGKNTLKSVWSGFPSNMKGVVWFFHSTASSSNEWVYGIEQRKVVDYFLANGLGVVITDAEESTLQTDLDGDGKIRWNTVSIDSNTNVDIKNILIIRREFIRRNSFSNVLPHFSLGMDNGGSFSSIISAYLKWKAGSSYCSQAKSSVFDLSTTPFQWCLADFDNDPSVGFFGNQEANDNYVKLTARNIVADIFTHQFFPLGPGRVKDATNIGLDTIREFINECIKERIMDSLKIPVLLAGDAAGYCLFDYPARFPSIKKMTQPQIGELFNQWGVSITEHRFYSDQMYRTYKFFADQLLVKTDEQQNLEKNWLANTMVTDNLLIRTPVIPGTIIKIFNNQGNCFLTKKVTSQIIDISTLPTGIYFVNISNSERTTCERIFKR